MKRNLEVDEMTMSCVDITVCLGVEDLLKLPHERVLSSDGGLITYAFIVM